MTEITNNYEFTEGTGANVWTITHNLNTEYPVVDCWIDAGQVGVDATYDEHLVPFDITVTDENIVVVTLENPAGTPEDYTGRALVT